MGAGKWFGRTPGLEAETPATEPSVDEARLAADQAALSRFRGGDQNAYGELFEKYRGIAVGYARRYTNSIQDAEDLAQDAFARVLQALRRGQGPTVSMRHYLLTAVRAIATDGFRRKTLTEYPTDPQELGVLYESEQYDDAVELAEWVVEGFNSLTDRQQALVWDHAVEGRSLTSIAPDLDISLASASRDYSKAMKTLRSCFASNASLASADVECEQFAPALVERKSRWGSETKAHVAGCANCQAIAKRLHSKDSALMSLVVVPGLGTFGLDALGRGSGTSSVVAAWWAGLGSPAKVAAGGLAVAAAAGVVSLAVALASHGDAGEAVTVQPFGAPEANGSVIASTDLCAVKRTVGIASGEVWQLMGDPSCTATVDHERASGTSRVRLGLGGRSEIRGLDIASAGSYRVTVSEAGERTSVRVHIPETNP